MLKSKLPSMPKLNLSEHNTQDDDHEEDDEDNEDDDDNEDDNDAKNLVAVLLKGIYFYNFSF
jgi:hypothetical protein